MQKKTPDYDNVFKTMKSKHKRLFISVINDTFGKNYPMDAEVETLPSEGYLTRQFAAWDIGQATIPMPRFSVIYIKRTEKTPKTTRITFTFPDGQEVNYASENVILEEFTKERIVEKRLFPYIPFYIARYEKDITNGNKSEERLVNIMGGTVIETASEKLVRKGREAGKAEEIIEMGQEFGLDDAAILKRLQEKIGLSLETAAAYLEQYGKQFV